MSAKTTQTSAADVFASAVKALRNPCGPFPGTADALEAAVAALIAERDAKPAAVPARALAEWHEDDGAALWFAWCGHDWAGEPAWAGTPLDSDWPGYHTHWIPHPSFPSNLDTEHDACNGGAK